MVSQRQIHTFEEKIMPKQKNVLLLTYSDTFSEPSHLIKIAQSEGKQCSGPIPENYNLCSMLYKDMNKSQLVHGANHRLEMVCNYTYTLH